LSKYYSNIMIKVDKLVPVTISYFVIVACAFHFYFYVVFLNVENLNTKLVDINRSVDI